MAISETTYQASGKFPSPILKERNIEDHLIDKLRRLNYTDRPDVNDRASVEKNFREKFEVVSRLRINTRRGMEQIVEYKNDPGNEYIWSTTGSGKTLTSFKVFTRRDALPSDRISP